MYKVSQQVWDRLNVIFWSSEACQRRLRILRQNVFCSIKLLFEHFLWTAKMKMEFLGNFSPNIICSNLFSKLSEIGEKWLSNPYSFLAVPKKGWKSNFLEQNTNFFVNVARFARKHFWAYPKLVGTPCSNKKNEKHNFFGLLGNKCVLQNGWTWRRINRNRPNSFLAPWCSI